MKPCLLAVLAFACLTVPAAFANSTYSWDFVATPNASLGSNTLNYSIGGMNITVTGSTALYYKVGGGDETGLGLACCDDDHEIQPGQDIVFNLSSLFPRNIASLTLMLGSIQSGETGRVCDAFGACETFTSADNSKAVSILSLYADMKAHGNGLLTITAGSGDVLVDRLQVTTGTVGDTVPEPASLLLMGTGLFAVAGAARRKLRV